MKGEEVNLKQLDLKDLEVTNHEQWTALLQKHVQPNGMVHYKGFLKDQGSLKMYLKELSKGPGKDWSEAAQIAFWINAYNAFTVQLILEHYPLNSIKDISSGLPMINSPWDIKFFKIANKDFDLNTIEHQILRKFYNEPRIHFAINCASFSCPNLRSEAFTADHLELQLDDQARAFILDSTKNKFGKKDAELSSIFSWFQSDFEQIAPLQKYIKQYKPDFEEDHKISFMEYDWSLNSSTRHAR